MSRSPETGGSSSEPNEYTGSSEQDAVFPSPVPQTKSLLQASLLKAMTRKRSRRRKKRDENSYMTKIAILMGGIIVFAIVVTTLVKKAAPGEKTFLSFSFLSGTCDDPNEY